MNYKLVTDSCCELTADLKKDLNAKSVPLMMIVGEKEYIDDETLDIDAFLNHMKNYPGKTKSSCPSPETFLNACETNVTNFIVTLSSRLSGSHSSACMAKEMGKEQEKEIHVFDSKSASAGEILVSMKISEFVKQGLGTLDIVSKMQDFIKNMKTFFVLDDLSVLIKNGRMSKITACLATVLNIRPILGSDGDGNIASYAKARGTVQSLEKLCSTIGDHCKNTAEKTLVITHCKNQKGASVFKKMVEKIYAFKEIIVMPTNGLSSMYANEGGIIIAF